MTDYKLVPAVPTPEMVEAAEDVYMPFGDMEMAIRMALLAAPAVQGEPGAITDADILAIAGRVESCPVSPWWLKDDVAIGDVRAAVLRFARALLATVPQPAEQPDPHPDDAAVDRFAAAMKAKLNKKRQEGRGGWQSMTAEQLSALLHEHVHKGDPLDVANLAMMLHQNGQRIEQQPSPDAAALVEALERSVAGFDALSGMASLDAGARNYARQKAIELNASLDAHRKQQEGRP